MALTVIDYLDRLEPFLKKVLATTPIPACLIRSATEYALFPGGKRIRPLLVYHVGVLLDVDLEVLDVIAAAIELTHCYSLIHDDLPAMDNDDYRRGQPSCHKQFDEATAILVGDGLQALAIELLLVTLYPQLPAAQALKITQELVKASGFSGMVSGQSLDLSELSKTSLTEPELQTIHRLKTGTLISACISMVLATQEQINAEYHHLLTAYGEHVGLVFQIQDDYLDRYAPQNTLGKNRASDLANKKTTFATLFTKEQLEQHISWHYQKAQQCLLPFGTKAVGLQQLTHQVQQRSLL